MRKNRTEILAYINTLKGYEGYVQFSHRPIEIEKDVFIGCDPKVADESGFVYEAHFSDGKQSVGIRQLNDTWLVDTTNIADVEVETYHGIADLKINMAQIWEAQSDALCEEMQVVKLKKVVFAGFAKGEV